MSDTGNASALAASLTRVRVVLVEPQYDGNLGKVARAMRNFGLSRLTLVGGQADPQSDEARWFARDEGEPVLEAAERQPALNDAIADCRMVIGTSRRTGKRRAPALPETVFEETRPWSAEWDTALVFGREAHGLYNEELDLCQRLVWIPTDDACPSMNLSHAVSVTGYVLSRLAREALDEAPLPFEVTPAPSDKLEDMYQHARRVWCRIGYLHAQNPDAILRRWRQVFSRTALTEYDLRVIRALLHQTEWVAKVAGIPPGGPPDAPPGLFDKHNVPDPQPYSGEGGEGSPDDGESDNLGG